MPKYIKLFNTYNDYETAKSELDLPNVSVCKDNMDAAYYNPYVEPLYIDLGLPSGTLWATKNVGANSVTDYGNYYQYGKGADDYSITSGQSNYTGTENPLSLSKDTARQSWGDSWHTPTRDQMNELTANTKYSFVTINGVNGGKFTSKIEGYTDRYIFLPAAGDYSSEGHTSEGTVGTYWSSTPSGSGYADVLYLDNGFRTTSSNQRATAFSIRPVIG